jgi:hypothetical protein
MKRAPFVIAIAVFLAATTVVFGNDDPPKVTHDGLHLVQDSKVAVAWVDPDADFSIYKRVGILDCYVAFKKDWANENRVSAQDQQRIKDGVAKLFREVFVQVLEENDGFEVVDGAAPDVLLLRPAITDLEITAPDTSTAGRSRNIVASSGSAVLFIELFDSVSSDILARAIDRSSARNTGFMNLGNSVENSADARRAFTTWARLLRDRMDEIHGGMQ